MRPRYTLAKRRAAALLHEIGIHHPPVPVERIAAVAGATLRFEPLAGQLSGMVHRTREGNAIIGVNSLHPGTRQRFTIAHEIGHLVLHDDETTHVDDRNPIAFRDRNSSTASDAREIEANQFAAELLMPAEMVMASIRNIPEDVEFDEGVKSLARAFEVSVEAITIRLSVLGLIE